MARHIGLESRANASDQVSLPAGIALPPSATAG